MPSGLTSSHHWPSTLASAGYTINYLLFENNIKVNWNSEGIRTIQTPDTKQLKQRPVPDVIIQWFNF